MTYNFDEFKKKHAQVIEFCQIIEYELKYIDNYLYLLNGYSQDSEAILYLFNATLRDLANILKSFVMQMPENLYYDAQRILSEIFPRVAVRNFWAHNSFTDLRFAKDDDEDIDSSKTYEAVCKKLDESYMDFNRICVLVKSFKIQILKISTNKGIEELGQQLYTRTKRG